MENIDYKTIFLVVLGILIVYLLFFKEENENFAMIEHAKNVKSCKKKCTKKCKKCTKKCKKCKKLKGKKKKTCKKKCKKCKKKCKKCKKGCKKEKGLEETDTEDTETEEPTETEETTETESTVDVGVAEPAAVEQPGEFDKLTADESYLANVKFSKMWTAYPDDKTDAAEISNDTENYKQLMIVGNKSAGGVRQVGVWDQLNVNGTLQTNGKLCVGQTCINESDLKRMKG
jgi:hypothetical protein